MIQKGKRMKNKAFKDELILRILPGEMEVAHHPEILQGTVGPFLGLIFFYHWNRKIAIAAQLDDVHPMLPEIHRSLRRWENVSIFIFTHCEVPLFQKLLRRELDLIGDHRPFVTLRVSKQTVVKLNTQTGEFQLRLVP